MTALHMRSSRSFQEFPGASRSFQEFPGVSRSFQELQEFKEWHGEHHGAGL